MEGSDRFVATVSVARLGDVQALVDTGACVSMIREELLPSHLRAMMNSYRGIQLRDANGRPVLPVGSISLTIRQGGETIDVANVAVVRTCPQPMLLGGDYLNKRGGFIDCRTGELVPKVPPQVEKGRPDVGVVPEANAELSEILLDEGTEMDEHRTSEPMGNACCAVPGKDTGHLHCDGTRLNIRPAKEIVVQEGSTQFVEFLTGLVEGTTVMVESKRHLHVTKEWVTPRTVSVVSAGGSIFLPVTNLGMGNLMLKKSEKVRAFRVGKGEELICKDDDGEGNGSICAVVPGEATSRPHPYS